MRAYAPVTIEELRALIDGKVVELASIFRATPEYQAANSDLDEEECEYNLSQEAAERSLAQDGSGLIIALEVEDAAAISWEQVQCLFECQRSDADSEIELLWFAPSEIAHRLDGWVST